MTNEAYSHDRTRDIRAAEEDRDAVEESEYAAMLSRAKEQS